MRKEGLIVIGCLLLLAVSSVRGVAQSTSNPFDLTPPTGEEEVWGPQAIRPVQTGNPFDLIGAPPPSVSPKAATRPAPVVTPGPPRKQSASEPNLFGRFVFSVIMIMLVVLTLLFTLFRKFFQRAYRAFLNDNMLNQIHRDQGAVVDLPYFYFYCLFFFNAGIFLFLALNYWDVNPGMAYWKLLLLLVGGLASLFFGKHTLLKFLGAVFPISKELDAYSFTIVIFSIMLGMLLVPMNLLIAFGPAGLTGAFIYLTLGLVGIAYAFRSVRSLLLGARFLALHKFHFLLYICTVEIAPVLVLVKLLKNFSNGL